MERDQLEQLYQAYARETLIYAKVLTKNHYDAESLVSDAFFQLSLQTSLPQEVKFWLFRVIKNRYLDQIRKRQRWGWQSLDKFVLISREKPESKLFQDEAYQELYQAIEGLNSPYQEAIIFFYFLEWSTTEISHYLQMSPGQVRTILYRARKQLRGKIDND